MDELEILGWLFVALTVAMVALWIDLKFEPRRIVRDYLEDSRRRRFGDAMQKLMEEDGAISFRRPIKRKHQDSECDDVIFGGDDVPPTAA